MNNFDVVYSVPPSLMSRLAMTKESVSLDFIHLSTTLLSNTVGMKSYPVPYMYRQQIKILPLQIRQNYGKNDPFTSV